MCSLHVYFLNYLKLSKPEINYSGRISVNWVAPREIKKCSDFLQLSQGAYYLYSTIKKQFSGFYSHLNHKTNFASFVMKHPADRVHKN